MATIFIGAIIVGMILGLLGSGGSAIMVPILVYLVGHDAKISIAESLAIVGAISASGAIPFARSRQVDWQSVTLFGLPSMLGAFIGALLGGLATDAVQLTVFGTVLLLASGLMLAKAFGNKSSAKTDAPRKRPPLTIPRAILAIVEGTLVGVLTGFVGVGGGFLIVPALLILGKLPMRTAIGTSLVIIVMNSAVGFVKYQHFLTQQNLSVDWQTIGIFVGVGIVGCFIGQKLNSKLNQRALQQVFAVFLVLIGGFVVFKEGSELLHATDKSTVKAVSASDHFAVTVSTKSYLLHQGNISKCN